MPRNFGEAAAADGSLTSRSDPSTQVKYHLRSGRHSFRFTFHGRANRQSHFEIRPLAYFAVDLNRSTMLTDDALADRQAQTGAALFSGIVCVENVVSHIRGHTGAGVDHIDRGEVTVTTGRENQFTTAPVHRLHRINHQIQHGLLDELGIDGCHKRAIISFAQSQLHAVELRLRGEKVGEVFEQLIDICGLTVHFHLAGVFEEVFERFAQSSGFTLHGAEPIKHPLLMWIASVQIFSEQLEIELNCREGVFDFVGESTCEGAQFGETFGITRAAFQARESPICQHAGANSCRGGKEQAGR